MLEELQRLVREAGKLLLKGGDAAIHDKQGHFNFVTDRDVEVQAFLKEGLLSLLPGSRFFAEEQENGILDDQPTWIVDPIDGTVNFTRGRAFSAVSVALAERLKPVLAVIYNPYSGELFSARLGQGAQLNGRAIHVSNLPLERALITFGTSPYNPQLSGVSLQAALALLRQAGDLRRTGSAALDLAWLACGRTDFFFELSLSPWDFAAGALLVREAGGLIGTPEGELQFSAHSAIVAGSPACYEQGLGILKRAMNNSLLFSDRPQ